MSTAGTLLASGSTWAFKDGSSGTLTEKQAAEFQLESGKVCLFDPGEPFDVDDPLPTWTFPAQACQVSVIALEAAPQAGATRRTWAAALCVRSTGIDARDLKAWVRATEKDGSILRVNSGHGLMAVFGAEARDRVISMYEARSPILDLFANLQEQLFVTSDQFVAVMSGSGPDAFDIWLGYDARLRERAKGCPYGHASRIHGNRLTTPLPGRSRIAYRSR